MRLLKINAPQGKGAEVMETAFAVGIKKVSIHETETFSANGKSETRDVVDIETSTPNAKRFVDAFLEADYYNRKDFSLAVRGALSIVSDEKISETTRPLADPVTDILEELWQFNHITFDFVGRIFIAACFIAYGLIQHQLLIMIAGLLFLPLLPLLLGIGFSSWTQKWKLTLRSSLAFATATALLVLGGVVVALMCEPPLKYDEFNSLGVSFLISLAVGIAAGLAHIDDAGKRELIGLAATAQLAIIPVWFGICMVFGFPPTTSQSDITTRALAFFVNFLTIIAASLAVYILTGAASRSLKNIKEE